jgi:glycosyltransferase involved in cell wall biosynthesis
MHLHFLFVWSYWQYPEVALDFLLKIRDKGDKVSVILGNFESEFDPSRYSSNIDFYFAPIWNGLSKVTRTPYPIFRDIASCFKVLRPDIVHINSHLFLSNYQAAKVACSLGLPVVVTVHGVMASRSLFLRTLQRVYLWTVARSLFNSAKAVICLTENDASAVAELIGGYHKISVIPNGVDLDLFKPSSKKIEGLITWIGRLVPEKGLIYLLRAMRDVIREVPNARLLVIGDGISRNKLMSLSRQFGLADNVEFLGAIGRMEVAKILSRASVFAFPSLREGLPLSVLEAMSCGVPVVGSDIPGVNDLIDNGVTGILVPPRDQMALARAIISLLKNYERQRVMGLAARHTIVNKYSWSSVIQKLSDVYNAVVQK